MSSRLSLVVLMLLIPGCAGSSQAPSASPSPGSATVGTAAPDAAALAAAGAPATKGAADHTAPPEEAPSGDATPAPAAFYTEEQARRGQRAFRQVCSDCHYTSEFKGPVFTDAWARRTARDLYRELRRTMPDDNPGGLPRQTYVDVMAYILELNGYPAGADELPPDDEILGGVRLAPPGERGPGL